MTLEKNCEVCGRGADDGIAHVISERHICNKKLSEFKDIKKKFTGNRAGLEVSCSASSSGSSFDPLKGFTKKKMCLSVKPGETITYSFRVANISKKDSMHVIGVQLAHALQRFQLDSDGVDFDKPPHSLPPKSELKRHVTVKFSSNEVGQFEMPLMITVKSSLSKRKEIIVRELVVFVEEQSVAHEKVKSPYTDEYIMAAEIIPATRRNIHSDTFRVPKNLKQVFGKGLVISDATPSDQRDLIIHTKDILERGIQSQSDFTEFFHNLLWFEETVAKQNLRKYNMKNVPMERHYTDCYLLVPGLSEKRPSLLRGDAILVRPSGNEEVMYQGEIIDLKDSNTIKISKLDPGFIECVRAGATFDVRFIMSREPYERMHNAVQNMQPHMDRIFPEANKKIPKLVTIDSFVNQDVASNPEQRSAVQHIVSGTSGRAPYMVFGPPGTGKTITIVEAILQLVKMDPSHRILVCTDSNMAADHIACAILRHGRALGVPDLLLRANSRFRQWEVMPDELVEHSNGRCVKSYKPLCNAVLSKFRVVVTTLSHSAKYGMPREQSKHRLSMTHLFIDEAAQASEPACCVPLSALLLRAGLVVLAGDPKQLGPVCISRKASKYGLGVSLMERLIETRKHLYTSDDNYITMLKNNFRSNPDILDIPNNLFYMDQLRACAPIDPLSAVEVLGGAGGGGGGGGGTAAIVFHGVMSQEQQEGKSPSFFNTKEIEIVKQYTLALVTRHGVRPKDIGVVTPYARQMHMICRWLMKEKLPVEVGTVEAFQGKEKRVIIITTVRANCKFLDYDAKFQLGFLVDDKRFNVALTRAKAKAIVIGNPSCLQFDEKWLRYMRRCQEHGTYYGVEFKQVERTVEMLYDIAVTRFNTCGLTEALKTAMEDDNKKK